MSRNNNPTQQEVVVTPKGNYIVPSLSTFINSKAVEARRNAARHILTQDAPNVPILPSRAPWSVVAGVLGMSDADRIKYFGTTDPQTCIYTATSQFNDSGALVSGNKTFRKNPSAYGFKEIPIDSVQNGDLVQFSNEIGPHHSTLVTGKDENGSLLSYSNGNNIPFDVLEDGDTIFTMVRNNPLQAVADAIGTPAAFRYEGSPQKKAAWMNEYFSTYNLRPTDYIFDTKNVEPVQPKEEPDALRVNKPAIQQPIKKKSDGGWLHHPKTAWDALSLEAKAEMIDAGVRNGITDLYEIQRKYNEYKEGGGLPETDWSYGSWKKQLKEKRGLEVEEDNTYDYEGFFQKYPEEAWKALQENPEAHFTDEFKTAFHPTFSSQSKYSGTFHPVYNPDSLKGGVWNREGTVYRMSPDGYRGPVSMDDRIWYLSNAENNGVQLRKSDGSFPYFQDGTYWGGVLPNVTIRGNKNSSLQGPLVDHLLYRDGGEIDWSSVLKDPEESAIARAYRVFSNYSQAKDSPLSVYQEDFRNGLRFLKDNIYSGIPAGISNCTLTATQWIDPSNPIKNASSIIATPGKYNYTPINAEDVVPGNLLIARNPEGTSHHTMLVEGFVDKDGTYSFDGKNYKVKKGEPLLRYSRGGHDNSFIRKGVPLSVYTANSDGKTENRFFRYNYPNEVFLPEIIVKPNKSK